LVNMAIIRLAEKSIRQALSMDAFDF